MTLPSASFNAGICPRGFIFKNVSFFCSSLNILTVTSWQGIFQISMRFLTAREYGLTMCQYRVGSYDITLFITIAIFMPFLQILKFKNYHHSTLSLTSDTMTSPIRRPKAIKNKTITKIMQILPYVIVPIFSILRITAFLWSS